MLSVAMGLFRILFPALMEWLKSKKLGPKSDQSLKEINQLFIMNVLLVAVFLAALEHGISIYATYTDKLREAAYVRRETEYLSAQVEDLKERNQFLRGRYSQALQAIEFYVDGDPNRAIKTLEDKGVIEEPPTTK